MSQIVLIKNNLKSSSHFSSTICPDDVQMLSANNVTHGTCLFLNHMKNDGANLRKKLFVPVQKSQRKYAQYSVCVLHFIYNFMAPCCFSTLGEVTDLYRTIRRLRGIKCASVFVCVFLISHFSKEEQILWLNPGHFTLLLFPYKESWKGENAEGQEQYSAQQHQSNAHVPKSSQNPIIYAHRHK